MRPAITSLMSLVFAAWLSVVATSPGALAAGVNDEGGFFSPGAVEKADAKIDEIRRDCGKGLLIDTVASVPESQQAKYNELGKKEFFVAWARQRAEEARVKGIYILICRKPAHVQVEIDRPTLAKAFTADDRERLLKRMLPLLREKQNDAALLQTVDFVAATLRANVGRRAAVAGGTIRVERAAPHGGGSSWGWIGIIALVALGCWLLMGVMRGVSGMGGGGAGPGYGGGWGGGGGGGFFSSLLGGMFGAAAGSWLYDSFFRGGFGGSQGFGSPGDTTPTDDAGAGDFSGDTGGGGDFGDDGGGSGGGDFGVAEDPSGGDFGGGDFGGGDFG